MEFLIGWFALTFLIIAFVHSASYKDNVSRDPNYYQKD